MQPLQVLLIWGLLALHAAAQWPMYEPGASIDRSAIPIKGAMFGFDYGSTYGCKTKFYQIACEPAQVPEPSLCQNLPASVSVTPYVKYQTGGFFLLLSNSGQIAIQCGTYHTAGDSQSAPVGTRVVYTTNGTYPDIYGPSYDHPVLVDFESGVEMFLLARCIEPGKQPSRFAYAERSIDNHVCTLSGGLWSYETHYKPLELPQCQPWVVGIDKCDGQTIVEHPATATVTPSQSPTDRAAAECDVAVTEEQECTAAAATSDGRCSCTATFVAEYCQPNGSCYDSQSSVCASKNTAVTVGRNMGLVCTASDSSRGGSETLQYSLPVAIISALLSTALILG